MWPYPWTHVGTPSHLGHMDRVAATMPSQAHAGAAQEAPDIGQWEGQDVPLVRPSSCNVKGGIPSSRRYLPTYMVCWRGCCWCWCWARPAFGWSVVPGVPLVAGGWSVCGPGGVVLVVSAVGEVGAVGGWRWHCVAAVGGAGDGVGEGAAGGAVGDMEGEGAVGDAPVDGGVLTVGMGPCQSWRRFPWALLARVLAPLVSLMSMVLYRVVSMWRLPLTPWVFVAEVALSVAVS